VCFTFRLPKPRPAAELIPFGDGFFIKRSSVPDPFEAGVASKVSIKHQHAIRVGDLGLWPHYNSPRDGKLCLLGVVDGAKRRLDTLRGHLCQP
jgi:hypothetical protein